MIYGKALKPAIFLTVVLLVTLALSGCSDKYSAKVTPEPAAETTTTETGEPAVAMSTGCLEISPEKMAEIEASLTVSGGGSLRAGRAVKSEDFDNIYFLAAEMEGPGLYSDEEIALWAVESLEAGQGAIMSVNTYAKAHSDLPKASDTNPEITTKSHGAAEAMECVVLALMD